MKLLRETIRKILLENTAHYKKIATLLCTGDVASVKQAIELAETMGYIHQVEYELWEQHYHVHRWTFSAVKEFQAIILEEWDNTSMHNRRFGSFVIYPIKNHSIGIKIVETIG